MLISEKVKKKNLPRVSLSFWWDINVLFPRGQTISTFDWETRNVQPYHEFKNSYF